MDLQIQKQNKRMLKPNKKYKLSFFGYSPRYDWAVAFNVGVILLILFSVIYYRESERIKKTIAEDNIQIEEKIYFDIEKAKKLLVDQTF